MKIRLIILFVFLTLGSLVKAQNYAAKFKDVSGKWGFINPLGEVIVKPKYTTCRPFKSGMAKVGLIYFINEHGQKMQTKEYLKEAKEFGDGLLAVKIQTKWGFINRDGELVIPAIYKNVTSFNDGLSVVESKEGFEILNKEGKRIEIKTVKGRISEKGKLTEIKPFKNGLAEVVVDLYPGPNDELRSGFINVKGELVIKPEYVQVGDFYEGLCRVRTTSGRISFIDKLGNVVIKTDYIRTGNFSGGFAWVRTEDGKIGFIDKKGEMLIQPQFSTVKDFDPLTGIAMVKKGKKWDYVNSKGESLGIERMETYKKFSEGFALVQKDKLWGYIDATGKWLVSPKYKAATAFKNGFARVKIKGKWGVINKEGKLIVDPIYKNIKEFHSIY